jgi:hypothetical protein
MAQFRIDRNQYLSDGKTIFEVGMLRDGLTPSGSIVDAFGRLRTSEPYTLFDSQHRYQMNDRWDTSNTANGTIHYSANESSVFMNVTTYSTDAVIRETKRVFKYQSGKSLLTFSSFKFDTPKANTVMRVGYYGANDGVYFENSNANSYIVLRSSSSGSMVETKVAQSEWNGNKFDGALQNTTATGTSDHGAIDVTKTNIFYVDLEWLGVGDVRVGFVVDGQPIPAHTFHNDNTQNAAYMTTAMLPLRYEVFNTGTANSSTSIKQICSTVISEGGYQGRSNKYSVGTALNSLKDLTNANSYYPLVSIRLPSTRLDAIILPESVDLITGTNNAIYQWKIIRNATLANTNWQTHYRNNVEYDISANNVITDGNDLNSGFITQGTGTGSYTANFGSLEDFNIQLGRTIAGVSDTITIAAQSTTAGADIGAILRWFDLTN